MFSKFKQIFAKRNKPLRKRILFTLICLSIFIIGTNIKVPGTVSKDTGPGNSWIGSCRFNLFRFENAE